MIVGLGDIQYARHFKEEAEIDFPILVDDQKHLYNTLELKQASLTHLLRPGNFKARARAIKSGHRQGRTGKNPFQLGGTFAFGQGNLDIFSHVSQTFGDNYHPEKLLSALKRYLTSSSNKSTGEPDTVQRYKPRSVNSSHQS